ncbi:MAG: hypothetical protein M1824_006110 [Vezdaea acicularis]|nr:MAG: hypothetical protein M1824_006110 [Vezdaea acicularis]
MRLSLNRLLVGAALVPITVAIPQKVQDRSLICVLDALLPKLQGPAINSAASSFCSTYIGTTKTVQVDSTATSTTTTTTTTTAPGTTSTIVSTSTTTTDTTNTITSQEPDVTTTTTTTATVALTTVTSEVNMKRKVKRGVILPWFVNGFPEPQISAACTCLISTAPQYTVLEPSTTVTVPATFTSVEPGPTSATTTTTTETDTETIDTTTTLPPTQTVPATETLTSTIPIATSTIICGVRSDLNSNGNFQQYLDGSAGSQFEPPLGSQCLDKCKSIPGCLSYGYVKYGDPPVFLCDFFNATVDKYIQRNPAGDYTLEDLGCPVPNV